MENLSKFDGDPNKPILNKDDRHVVAAVPPAEGAIEYIAQKTTDVLSILEREQTHARISGEGGFTPGCSKFRRLPPSQ